MDDSAQLIWGFLFGAIGLGFFTYGKRQQSVVPLVSGILLCVFPYFVSNIYLLISVGAGLILIPFFL